MTHIAVTGAEALALVAETVFDLILLEIDLPDMNGKQFLTRLKALSGNTRVAIVSSHEEDYISDFPQIVTQILKPFSSKEFLAKVAEHSA